MCFFKLQQIVFELIANYLNIFAVTQNFMKIIAKLNNNFCVQSL